MKILKLDLSKVKRGRTLRLVVLDLVMLGVLSANLAWMSFDWLFQFASVQGLVKGWSLAAYELYVPVHADFIVYDSVFVFVFMAEIAIRWAAAIRRRTYHRWFFYPFIHWYDVLGCLPLAGLRWLRMLRAVGIVRRLKRMGVVDYRDFYLYKVVRKYTDIVVEEISDRVVVNVLRGVQQELRSGGPMSERIVREVLLPNSQQAVELFWRRAAELVGQGYAPRRAELRDYLGRKVAHALEASEHVRRLERTPLVGRLATDVLEKAISDIVFEVVDGLFRDAASPAGEAYLRGLAGQSVDELLARPTSPEARRLAEQVLSQTIDRVVEQVQVQQWKLKELAERAAEREAQAPASGRGGPKNPPTGPV